MWEATSILLFALAGGDLLSTELALQQPGFVEANPLMERREIRIPAKIGVSAGIYFGTEKLRNSKPKTALALRWIAIGLWGYATAANLRKL